MTTIAGGGSIVGDGLQATSAKLANPKGVYFHETNGDLYIADSTHNRIRKISALTGIISTVAGDGNNGFSGDGGLATSARLSNPEGVAVSSSTGDVYIVDVGNHRIRKISALTGIITTFAGTGTSGYSGDGGQATSAKLNNPQGVAITSSSGDLYIADCYNNRIRKVSALTGIISTVAGDGNYGLSGDGGLASIAQLAYPQGVTITMSGDLYIADSGNHRIRKISALTGIITTIAGTSYGFSNDGGLAVIAKLYYPYSVAFNSTSGDLFIADYSNHRIRKVSTSTGIITTIAGNGTNGYGSGFGIDENVQATSTALSYPQGIVINPMSGDLVITDHNNHRIRKISTRSPTTGIISTMAGTSTFGNNIPASLATLSPNATLFLDTIGNRLVFPQDGLVREVNLNTNTIISLSVAQQFPRPTCAMYFNNMLHVLDSNNHLYRVNSFSSMVERIVGASGDLAGYGGDGGSATEALINALSFDISTTSGDIYIADTFNCRIRKVSVSTGVITTVAGVGFCGFSGDGGLATSAQLNYPHGVTVVQGSSSTGNSGEELYIADTSNHRIRKISTSTGVITTIAGIGTSGYGGDGGLATSAQLSYPYSVAISSLRDIIISDTSNHRIRKISSLTGIIKTIAGNGTSGYSGDGGLSTSAQLTSPKGIAINSTSGEIFIVDSNRIRKLIPTCSEDEILIDGKCEYQCFGSTNRESKVCSGRGTCIGNNQCNCSSLEYFGLKCDEYYCHGILKNMSNVCSSHGDCTSSNTCSCHTGFYGERCQYFYCNSIPFNSPLVCSGHGECSSFNNCTCQQDYSGFNCQNFKCYGISSVDSSVCSSHGICSSNNNCSCTNDYYGNTCDQFSCNGIHYQNRTVCSTHGQCQSPNNCTCDSGYYGSNCEVYDCYGISKNNTNLVCSGHGECSSFNNCTCREGYYDSKCDSFNCAGEKFSGGSNSLCQNNGTCTGPGNCVCTYQYGGVRCEYVKCYTYTSNDARVCGGTTHGTCLGYNNCSCFKNYYGNDCSVTQCYGIESNSSLVCGGPTVGYDGSNRNNTRGKCTNFNECTCSVGYSGTKCENVVCYDRIDSDSLVCSGNGQCQSPNNCTCEVGYVGTECEYHQIYLNPSSAILFSDHESLMSLLPLLSSNHVDENGLFNCNDMFEESELKKFGLRDNIICQWRRKSLQIHLGFNYLIDHSSIIQTKLNFTMRVQSISSTTSSSRECSFGYMLTETSPLFDVIIRLSCDEGVHGFKSVRTVWTCDQCSTSISSLLNSYSNRSIIHIPISLMNSLNPIQGYKSINLQALIQNNQQQQPITISKQVKVQSYSKSQPPSYYWLSDNYDGKTYSCTGHNCILETSLNSLNSSISYSFSGFFSLLNSDLYSKQMVRMVNDYAGGVLDSEFNSNMQVFGVQLKTYVYLPFNVDSFKYSTFTNLDYLMTGINRTYTINSNIPIGLIIDDPYISKYTLSEYIEYTWKCYQVQSHTNRTVTSDNKCPTIENGKSSITLNSLHEGSYLIVASISSTRYFIQTNYIYEGYIDITDSPISITSTEQVPTITPSHQSIYWRNTVQSFSTLSSPIWTLKRGHFKHAYHSEEQVLYNSAITSPIMMNNYEIILNIDNEYLIQGEEYEFELSVRNSNGEHANISTFTRVDFAPRLSCSVENLKNLDINSTTSFESFIAVSCVKLPYESISSFVMEFHNENYTTNTKFTHQYNENTQLGIISNTPKRSLITRVPYYPSIDNTFNGNGGGMIKLVVKLQNLYGSIGIYQTSIKVQLPNELKDNNSIVSRFTYINKQFQIMKQSEPLKMALSNEINSLLSLLIQNETLVQFSQRVVKELNSIDLQLFNQMLRDMVHIIKSLRDITYRCDERVIQLVLPIINKIFTILRITTTGTTSNIVNDLVNWLDWIYLGMDKAHDYYSTFIFSDLLSNFNLLEIKSLQNMLQSLIENDFDQQVKIHKYNLKYIKLTGGMINSVVSVDNTSMIEHVDYSELLNDKSISLTLSNFIINMKLPSDFSRQISLKSKSKLYHSISLFNGGNIGSQSQKNPKPIVELSLYDDFYNEMSVKNVNPPIVIKFQGMHMNRTLKNTLVNTTCIYYDTSVGQWSMSGIQSLITITKTTDDITYFDLECHSSHLSLFSYQQEEYTPHSIQSSSGRGNTAQDSSNALIIILSTVLPIGFLILIVIVILLVLVILLFRNRQKRVNEHLAQKNNLIELIEEGSISDFPFSEGSMFIQPLMSISSNGNTSEAFNPLSRYSNLVRIGQGAFGSVFKAFDSKTSSVKAIKVIKYTSMEELNNIMKEGSQLMNVNHPYILRVNDFFVSKDQLLCIDMDFYELGDLVQLTRVDFNCSEQLIKQIIYQMCQALDYIHCNMKIIHRDIKPSNVFVKNLNLNQKIENTKKTNGVNEPGDSIHIIIADFGLAKSNALGQSTNNSYAGTPIFMSPELGLGGKYYYNTDIYSLGVTVYQIMTKDTVTSISQLYLSRDQNEVTELLRLKLQDGSGQYSDQLAQLVLSMLQKDNLVRPQAQDILEDSYFDDLKLKR